MNRRRVSDVVILTILGVLLGAPVVRGQTAYPMEIQVTGLRRNATAGAFVNALYDGIEESPYLRQAKLYDGARLALMVAIAPVDDGDRDLIVAFSVVLTEKTHEGLQYYIGSLVGTAGEKVAFTQGHRVMRQVEVWVQGIVRKE